MKAYSKGIRICSKPLEPCKVTGINYVYSIPCSLRSLFVELLRAPSVLCGKTQSSGCGQSSHSDINQTEPHFGCLTLGFYKRTRILNSPDIEAS